MAFRSSCREPLKARNCTMRWLMFPISASRDAAAGVMVVVKVVMVRKCYAAIARSLPEYASIACSNARNVSAFASGLRMNVFCVSECTRR